MARPKKQAGSNAPVGEVPVKMVHPEGSEAFPNDAADVEALMEIGFVAEEEQKPEDPQQ